MKMLRDVLFNKKKKMMNVQMPDKINVVYMSYRLLILKTLCTQLLVFNDVPEPKYLIQFNLFI